MPDLDLKYASDPTGDIVSRSVQIYFGQRAVKETVAVNKISATGMFSRVEKSTTLEDETIDGVVTCLGVTIAYTLYSQQINYIDPLNFSYARGARSTVTYVPGEINVKVSWDTKIPGQENNTITNSLPNTSGGAMPDISPVDNQIVIRAGFWLKCRNVTDIETYGNGEVNGEDYINPIIPDVAHGQRVGENLIFESLKNSGIDINTIPNFAIKPRHFIKSPISYLFFNETFKVESREFQFGQGAEQSFILHTRGRKY